VEDGVPFLLYNWEGPPYKLMTANETLWVWSGGSPPVNSNGDGEFVMIYNKDFANPRQWWLFDSGTRSIRSFNNPSWALSVKEGWDLSTPNWTGDLHLRLWKGQDN
jgi:hypothetical protein